MSSGEGEDWTDSDSSGTTSDSESSSEGAVTPRESPDEDGDHAGPLASVRGLNECLSGAALNYQLSCTATECTTCQIVAHVPVSLEQVSLAARLAAARGARSSRAAGPGGTSRTTHEVLLGTTTARGYPACVLAGQEPPLRDTRRVGQLLLLQHT